MTKFRILFGFTDFKGSGMPLPYVPQLIADWNKNSKKKDGVGKKFYEPLSGNISEVINVDYKNGKTIMESKLMFEGQFEKSSYSKHHRGMVPTPLAFKYWCDTKEVGISVELVES